MFYETIEIVQRAREGSMPSTLNDCRPRVLGLRGCIGERDYYDDDSDQPPSDHPPFVHRGPMNLVVVLRSICFTQTHFQLRMFHRD